jgi:hypothetical protein
LQVFICALRRIYGVGKKVFRINFVIVTATIDCSRILLVILGTFFRRIVAAHVNIIRNKGPLRLDGCRIRQNCQNLLLLVLVERVRPEEFESCCVVPLDIVSDSISVDYLVCILICFFDVSLLRPVPLIAAAGTRS